MASSASDKGPTFGVLIWNPKIHHECASLCKGLGFFLTENILIANKALTGLCLVSCAKKEQDILELFLRAGPERVREQDDVNVP